MNLTAKPFKMNHLMF